MDQANSHVHRSGVGPREPRQGAFGSLLNRVMVFSVSLLLRLRYRISVTGLEKVASRGQQKILFLANHTAMMDPVILLTILYKDFAPRSLADELRIRHPILNWLSRRFGAYPLPSVESFGPHTPCGVRRALGVVTDHLARGQNLLLYPAGRLKRQRREELGAASGVEAILRGVPDARIVLIRHSGLWGSSFSWAQTGQNPTFWPNLKHGFKYLLLNGLFFMPRRAVAVEFVEPADFPRHAGRLVINRFLEDFCNAIARPGTYVPYTFWEKGGVRDLPEPIQAGIQADTAGIAQSLRRSILKYLEEATGRNDLKEDHRLDDDLGLDSLAVMEIIFWLEKEFGAPLIDPHDLRTVGDVMLAAQGRKAAPPSTLPKDPGYR